MPPCPTRGTDEACRRAARPPHQERERALEVGPGAVLTLLLLLLLLLLLTTLLTTLLLLLLLLLLYLLLLLLLTTLSLLQYYYYRFIIQFNSREGSLSRVGPTSILYNFTPGPLVKTLRLTNEEFNRGIYFTSPSWIIFWPAVFPQVLLNRRAWSAGPCLKK